MSRYVFAAGDKETICRGHVVRICGYDEPLTVVDKESGYILVLSNGKRVHQSQVELIPPDDPQTPVVQDPQITGKLFRPGGDPVPFEYKWLP